MMQIRKTRVKAMALTLAILVQISRGAFTRRKGTLYVGPSGMGALRNQLYDATCRPNQPAQTSGQTNQTEELIQDDTNKQLAEPEKTTQEAQAEAEERAKTQKKNDKIIERAKQILERENHSLNTDTRNQDAWRQAVLQAQLEVDGKAQPKLKAKRERKIKAKGKTKKRKQKKRKTKMGKRNNGKNKETTNKGKRRRPTKKLNPKLAEKKAELSAVDWPAFMKFYKKHKRTGNPNVEWMIQLAEEDLAEAKWKAEHKENILAEAEQARARTAEAVRINEQHSQLVEDMCEKEAQEAIAMRRRLLRRPANEHPMDRLKRRLLQQNRYSRAKEHPMDRLKRRLLQQNRY